METFFGTMTWEAVAPLSMALTGLITAIVTLVRSLTEIGRRGRRSSDLGSSDSAPAFDPKNAVNSNQRGVLVSLLVLVLAIMLGYSWSMEPAQAEADTRNRTYLQGYEDIAMLLQRAAESAGFQTGESIRVQFSKDPDVGLHISVVEEAEEARFLSEFVALYPSAGQHEGSVPTALIRAYAGQAGDVAYNRYVSHQRFRRVEDILRQRYSPDELSIIGLPLGESKSSGSGPAWHYAEVGFLLAPRAGQSTESTQAQLPEPVPEPDRVENVVALRVELETSDESNSGTNAAVTLTLGSYPYELSGSFESGEIDSLVVSLDPSIDLKALRSSELELSHDGRGFLPGWKVQRLQVDYSLDGSEFFRLNEWTEFPWLSRTKGLSFRLDSI